MSGLRFHDGGTGEGDPGAVRESLLDVCAEDRRLGPVRLIDQEEDLIRPVKDRKLPDPLLPFLLELLHHAHDDVRGVGLQERFQFGDVPGGINLFVGCCGGLLELPLKVGAIGDENDLVLFQDGVFSHRPDKKDHRQRFAGALGVPDDAAFLSRILVGTQPCEDLLHRSILLVACDDLDLLTLIVLTEDGEVPEDLKEAGGSKHPVDQPLLTVGRLAVRVDRREGGRVRIFPLQVVLLLPADGGDLRRLPRSRDHAEVVGEEPVATLGEFCVPAVAVAPQLGDGFLDRLGDGGGFAFDNNERDTVDEEDDVGDDMFGGAGDGDLELADGEEPVLLRVVEVDVADSGARGAVDAVFVDSGVVQEQVGGGDVRLDERGLRDGVKAGDDLGDLVVFEKGVDPPEGFPEFGLDDDLAEREPLRFARLGTRREMPDFPAQPGELLAEGDFNVGLLVPGHFP